jgi:hypothetical protein
MLQEQKFLVSRIFNPCSNGNKNQWTGKYGLVYMQDFHGNMEAIYNGTSKCFQEQGKISWCTWKVYSDTRKAEDLKSL